MKKAILSLLLGIISLTIFAQSWVEVAVDTQYGPRFRPNDIEFVNDSVLLMGGNSLDYSGQSSSIKNGFFKSIDGGITWDTVMYFNSGSMWGDNNQIDVLDTLVFIVQGIGTNVGGTGSIYNPRCVGYKLTQHNLNLDFQRELITNVGIYYAYLKTIKPIDHKYLGMVLEYPDSGYYFDKFAKFDLDSLTYDTIPLPVYTELIHDIKFVDSQIGYIACGSVFREQSGYLLKTIDGGNTWSVIQDNSSSTFRCVEFYDRNIGVTSSGQGLMYYTRDGGFDWFPVIGIPSRFRAYDICRAGGKDAYAIGTFEFYENGLLQTYTQIYRSSNQGRSWCLVYEDTSFNDTGKMNISFVDENHGVAAYGYNHLIYTTNGGGLSECVTGISKAENEIFLSIFPNPNSGFFTIVLPENEFSFVSVFDAGGKLVWAKDDAMGQIEINGLNIGVYIVKVQNKKQSLTQKLIVTR